MANVGPSDSHSNDLALLDALPTLPERERRNVIERLVHNSSPAVRVPAIRVGAAVLTDDDLVGYLRDGTDDMLRNAGLDMLKQRGRRAISLGLKLLHDRDADVVLQAVGILDHVRDSRALEPLRSVLQHPDANVVQAAIVAIGHTGHAAAVADIIPFLTGDPWLQVAAVQALGDLRSPEGVEALAVLKNDPMVGSLACESLVWIGGPAAFRHLATKWLQDGAESDEALDRLTHVLEGLVTEAPNVDGFRVAVSRRLREAERDFRIGAGRCLLALGPGDDEQEALRILAAGSLDRLTVPACLSRRADLIGTLLGERGILRDWGFRLAARCPEAAPTEAIAAALTDHHGHEQLEPIAETLSVVDGFGLGEALLHFYLALPEDTRFGWGRLLYRHRRVLLDAMDTLDDLPSERRSMLAAVLEESPADASRAIVDLPRATRLEALSHVSHRSDVVRRLPWGTWLAEDPSTYACFVVEFAGELRDILPEVRRLLRVAPHADLIRIVAEARDHKSVPMLIELVEHGEPALQPFLLGALGELGGDEARQVLRSVATSGESRWSRFAFKGLANCATIDDEPLFREAVASTDWYVRLTCVEVLGHAMHVEDIPLLAQLSADSVAAVAGLARSFLDRNREVEP